MDGIRYGAVIGLALLCAGCSTLLQGKPIDLEEVATPPVVLAPVRLVEPQEPPAMDLSQAQRRAWVPRDVAANGDAVEGHFLEISDQAPADEVIAPSVHVPRAPKHILPAAKTGSKVRTLPNPDPQPPAYAPAAPYAVQPSVGVTVPLHGGLP